MSKNFTYNQLFDNSKKQTKKANQLKLPAQSVINAVLNYSKSFKSASDYSKAMTFRFPKELLIENLVLN